MTSPHAHVIACITVLLSATVASAQAPAESPEVRLLVGLRQRGLYRLAEIHGREQSQRTDLPAELREKLAIELSQTYIEHALSSPAADRDPLWQEATDTLDAYRDASPASAGLLLVDLQQALVELVCGESARMEAEGRDADHPLVDEARGRLRAAARRLADVAQDVSRRLNSGSRRRSQPRASAAGPALSPEELQALQKNVAYHRARALRGQALTYPQRTPDRDSLLLQAVNELDELVPLAVEDELVWNARIAAAGVLRELGRNDTASESLKRWQQASPPPAVAAELAAETVRLALARGETSEAVSMAQSLSDRYADLSPPSVALDMAYLAALVEAWRGAARPSPDAGSLAEAAADSSQSTAELRQRALDLLTTIRQRHPPHVVRRAELLLGRTLAEAPGEDDVDLMVLAAENLYRSGQADEAVAAYDRAAAAMRQGAASEQDRRRAFEIALTAAAIEQAAGRLGAAAERRRQLAIDAPAHPQAAATHRLAILTQAALLRSAGHNSSAGTASGPRPSTLDPRPAGGDSIDATGFSPTWAAYRQLLTEHIRLWPDSPMSDDANWWLCQLALSERDWETAASACEAIGPASEHFGEVVRAAGRCYKALLAVADPARSVTAASGDGTQAANENAAALLARARAFLQPVVTGSENRWPAEWSDLPLAAAASLAELHLRHGTSSAEVEFADRMAQAAFRGATAAREAAASTTPEPPGDEFSGRATEHRDTLRALLISAAALRDEAQARQLMQSEPWEDATDLYQVSEQLTAWLENGTSIEVEDAQRASMGRLALEAIALIENRPLDEVAQAALARQRAVALAATGRREAAVAEYRELARTHPQDGNIQEAYAALLASGQSAADRQGALDAWGEVEKHSRRGGPRWLRARRARIALLRQLRRTEEADRLERLTRILYPAK